MANSLLARFTALRALVALVTALLSLAALSSDVWAAEAGRKVDAGFVLYPANIDDEVEAPDSERVDGLLHVLMNDDGSLAGYVTEAMRWRLSVEARGVQALGLEDGFFTVRPSGSPLTEDCGGDAFCPAGYSASGSSNLIEFEKPQTSTTAGGEVYFRRAFTLVMPLDVTWVDFYGEFRNRVEQACMTAKETVESRSQDAAAARPAPLSANLGDYGLVATAFRGPGSWAETDLVVAVKCWPDSHSMETLRDRLSPKGR